MTLSVGPATAQQARPEPVERARPEPVEQVPTPPATFWGSVKVDGHSVPDGTQVLALIGDKTCGEAEGASGKGTWTASEDEPKYGIKAGDSLYAVDVVSDNQTPGCGTEGATVIFLVAGKPAHQQGIWKAGPNPLHLTAGSLSPGPENAAATPAAGQAPASTQHQSGGGLTWWPALAGGTAGLAAVVALGLWWGARIAARKRVT